VRTQADACSKSSRKGMRRRSRRALTRDCTTWAIKSTAPFIAGLTRRDQGNHQKDHRMACKINPHTHPGVAGQRLSRHLSSTIRPWKNGWAGTPPNAELVTGGRQSRIEAAALSPHLSHEDIPQLGGGILSPLLFPAAQESGAIAIEMVLRLRHDEAQRRESGCRPRSPVRRGRRPSQPFSTA